MTEEKVTFEQALAKLEQIVTEIEEGKVPLEESIERYAKGIALIKQCREILDAAEKDIQILVKGQDETLTPAGQLGQSEDQQADQPPI